MIKAIKFIIHLIELIGSSNVSIIIFGFLFAIVLLTIVEILQFIKAVIVSIKLKFNKKKINVK